MKEAKRNSNNQSAWENFKKWWNTHREIEEWSDLKVELKEHPVFSQAMEKADSLITVLNMRTMKSLHWSGNIQEFTGWEGTTFADGGIQFAHSCIHPEDAPGIHLFSEKMNRYYETLNEPEKLNYQDYLDFRARRQDGTYQRILQRGSVLKHDHQGSMAVLLLFLIKITHHKSDRAMHLRLTNGNENQLFEYLPDKKSFGELSCPSVREIEVFRLISQGYERTDVAKKLGISLATVKTHCHHTYKKLRVNDSIEAISLLKLFSFL